MKSFHGSFFSILYPDNWELEIIENIPGLFRGDGPGALLLIAFRYEDVGGVSATRELIRYLNSRNLEVPANKIVSYELNNLDASGIEFIHDGRFWMANIVGKDHKYILFLWNSDVIPDREITEEISFIISSIRYID